MAIHVFINRRKVELPSSPLTGEQILDAGDYGADYNLFLLKGEGDPSGGTPVDRSESIDVKNGMHFRAIPGNANFGAAPNTAVAVGNEALVEDLERLSEQGFEVDVLVEGAEVGIVIRGVPLPPGAYSIANTDLLLKTTTLYPQSEMDMFWVDPDLVLASGAEPASSNLEMHFGRPWRRFSWHRNTPWVPGRDDLLGHFEFARARLQRPQ
jgi:hypothetical protein